MKKQYLKNVNISDEEWDNSILEMTKDWGKTPEEEMKEWTAKNL